MKWTSFQIKALFDYLIIQKSSGAFYHLTLSCWWLFSSVNLEPDEVVGRCVSVNMNPCFSFKFRYLTVLHRQWVLHFRFRTVNNFVVKMQVKLPFSWFTSNCKAAVVYPLLLSLTQWYKTNASFPVHTNLYLLLVFNIIMQILLLKVFLLNLSLNFSL